jgi:cytoskeletal protein RodZ
VPQSQEKTPEPETELPNPELNPLLNPTLGRHLGRWAQVYFTSPPEKREEAVGELLRELQGQPANLQGPPTIEPDQAFSKHDEPGETLRIVEAVAEPLMQQCSACGHVHTTPQRFCGMCGAGFEAEPNREETPLAATGSRKPVSKQTELASFAPAHESMPFAEDSFSDIRWLREKSLSGDSGSSWRPRYAPAIIAVLAIGILFYAQTRPQRGPTQQSQQSAKNAEPTPPSSPAKGATETPSPAVPTPNPPRKAMDHSPERAATSPESAPSTANTRASQTTPAALPGNDRRGAPAHQIAGERGSAPHSDTSGTAKIPASAAAPPQAASVPNPINGAAELAMAEDFLNGRTHPRNTEEAAKYLWRSVGKENPSAILLLSDMYLVGDGVPKSCDQARLLLSAAARKGVPQAADKLRDLLRSGCPK